MIVEPKYSRILTNLSRGAPVDLDKMLFDVAPTGNTSDPDPSVFPPSSALWSMPDNGPSRIGLRIKTAIADPDFLAARLASIALERQIHPIFLSYIAQSGMQRFGFRVEQLSGLTAHAQQDFEAQLQRFWRFALIIDASDIDRLG